MDRAGETGWVFTAGEGGKNFSSWGVQKGCGGGKEVGGEAELSAKQKGCNEVYLTLGKMARGEWKLKCEKENACRGMENWVLGNKIAKGMESSRTSEGKRKTRRKKKCEKHRHLSEESINNVRERGSRCKQEGMSGLGPKPTGALNPRARLQENRGKFSRAACFAGARPYGHTALKSLQAA